MKHITLWIVSESDNTLGQVVITLVFDDIEALPLGTSELPDRKLTVKRSGVYDNNVLNRSSLLNPRFVAMAQSLIGTEANPIKTVQVEGSICLILFCELSFGVSAEQPQAKPRNEIIGVALRALRDSLHDSFDLEVAIKPEDRLSQT